MTHAKKLKKEIRARAARTGESYTAARRHVLLARGKNGPAAPPSKAKPPIGDAAVAKATGRGLDHWFAVLDAFGAVAKGHTASAAHLNEDHGVRGWYSQMITVAYERARGKRSRNQSCAGDFQVGVSRAVNAPVHEVMAALREGRWLDGVDPELARALPKPATLVMKGEKYAKLRYKWDGSAIEIRVTPKKGGSTIVADNTKLADAAQVERRRAQWRGALDALRAFLAK
jgi:hypothetical protein